MCIIIINNTQSEQVAMRTNIEIDDKLMAQAMAITHLPTKRAVVEEGIKLLIQMNRQSQVRKFKGKLKWEGNLDKMRRDE